MMRQVHFVAFLQAQNCTTLPASWRHPDARTDTYSPEYYQHIARVLEAGRFDVGFFDDRLAMPDMYGGDHAETVKNGIRCVKLDAVTCLMSMAAVTKHLGLGATYSTTYYEPFHVARLFQTVDLMTKGRAAWNVVTSVNDNEAKNMGREVHTAHDLRYDEADEFMEIVLGHWDSWDDDAIVVDKKNNVYAHPGKVRRIDFEGKFMSSRGPFTVPRTPQGHPVVIQAGMSPRGQEFAARWGELLFVVYHDLEVAQKRYKKQKELTAAVGRDPEGMRICSLFYPITAATKAEAEDKAAAYEKLPNEMDQLLLLSEALNFDFASKGIDQPFTDDEIAGISGMQTMRDRVVVEEGIKNPTPRDFMQVTGRGLLRNAWVGGPKEIADQIEEWWAGRACDGFVIGPTHQPGSLEDFVQHVVPELQKRGIYRTEYSGQTLRDHLGIARPEIGAWRHDAAAAE